MGFLKSIMSYFAPGEEECRPRELGRNDDCWCGSGRKYKRCHLEEDEKKLRAASSLKCGKT
jgi:uncharacterized protein YecA (UPF0149 family)